MSKIVSMIIAIVTLGIIPLIDKIKVLKDKIDEINKQHALEKEQQKYMVKNAMEVEPYIESKRARYLTLCIKQGIDSKVANRFLDDFIMPVANNINVLKNETVEPIQGDNIYYGKD